MANVLPCLIPDHRRLIHRSEVLVASSVAPSQLIDNPLAVRWIIDDILLREFPIAPIQALAWPGQAPV